MGKEKKKNGMLCFSEGELVLGPLSRGYYLSLAGRNLRGGLRGGFQQNLHQFSRCVLSGSWSPLIGQ